MPVYNVEKYINRCIESILKQENVDFELILIDDGSTDKSGEICDQYVNDKRVTVVHQDNKGVSAARNVGIKVSKGVYLWFIDADDWIVEGALSCLINKGQNADIIVFGSYNAKETGNNDYIITDGVSWKNKCEPFIVLDKYTEIFNKNVTLWNKLIKKSILGNIRFDESKTYGEDCDFLCGIMPKIKTAIIVPYGLYYYFVNRQGGVVSSKIDSRSLELLDNAKSVYDKLVTVGKSTSGVRRIFIAANEVLYKVPLTRDGIKDNQIFIKAVRDALMYPKLQDMILFYLDETIDLKIRLKYLLILLNPFHMYYLLFRRCISDFIKKK